MTEIRIKRKIKIKNWALAAVLGAYCLCAAGWMGVRVYLQAAGIRRSPQLDSCLVLKEIEPLKPFTSFMFTDQPVYSFHAGIPMRPSLAVITLKRLWSGELTNERIAAELRAVKPGLMLLASDTRELHYQDLLEAEYRLVYEDGDHRLYALKTVIDRANR